jgi:hypothetical protein
MGLSCRNGQGAIERLVFAMALASRWEACAILEYDVLFFKSFKSAPECQNGPWGGWVPFNHELLLCSEIFPNQDPSWLYAAPTYGHAPWIATGETWWKLLQAGSDSQNGFPDRWLANAAQRAKVALRGMEGSYSRDQGFDARTARLRRLAGAPCVHGVKTEEEFAEILREDDPAVFQSNFEAFQKYLLENIAAGLHITNEVLYDDSKISPNLSGATIRRLNCKRCTGAGCDDCIPDGCTESFPIDEQEEITGRTSCPACNGTGCDRCIPSEYEEGGAQ